MEPPFSYGTTTPLAEQHTGVDDVMFRQHKRISRVVTSIAGACALIFVIAVVSNPPAYHKHATGMQQLADIQGFGCHAFRE
jgi:hypothetical protein